MNLIKISNKQYPISTSEFKLQFPNVTFPQEIDYSSYGYEFVYPTPQPSVSRLEIATEITPVLNPETNQWEQQWEILNITSGIEDDDTYTRDERLLILAQTVTNEKIKELASVRYAKEISGITIDDSSISTDRVSQSMIASAYTSLKEEFITNTLWKESSGKHTLITITEMKLIASAVANHVKSCFDVEGIHSNAIMVILEDTDLTNEQKLNSIVEYDITVGWPVI